MMRIEEELRRHKFQQPILDFAHRFAGRDSSAIRDPKYVRIHRNGRLAECRVENHVGGFAADTGQLLERLASCGHLTGMAIHQQLRHSDDVLGLGVVQAIDLMYFDRPLTPSDRMAPGAFAARNNSAVALFTLLSVA